MTRRGDTAWWLTVVTAWACGGDDSDDSTGAGTTLPVTTTGDESSGGSPTTTPPETTNGNDDDTADGSADDSGPPETGPAESGEDSGPGESGEDTGPAESGDDTGPGGSSGGGALDMCLMMAADDCEACACNNCLDQVTTCQADPGCVAIRTCAQENDCTGLACLGPCGGPIGMYPDSLAAAMALSDCYEGSCSDC
jgi:hypothetical protein